LEHHGVSTVIHYPIPAHRQGCYPEYSSQPLPIADMLAGEVLSLPMSPDMSEAEIEQVCSTLLSFDENI
jgi:dTDP-4-amino-4,6-dideoxygalactose transaminase